MNAREKKLTIATVAVMGLGLLSLLMTRGAPPPPRSPQPRSSSSGSAAATPPVATPPPGPGTGPTAFMVPIEALDRLLDLRLASAEAVTFPDPFRPLHGAPETAVRRPPSTPTPSTPNFRVQGVFLSGPTRGAVLDDRICFVGDVIGGYELIEVTTSGVRLADGATEVELRYTPIRVTDGRGATDRGGIHRGQSPQPREQP